MSVEEEIELKDLVAQTLKFNGTLAKIKAQLRASLFLALDEDEKISSQTPLLNNKIKTFMETTEGKSMFYIVHEFLEFFNLSFTLAVYEPESYLDCDCQKEEKQRIAQQFGLENIEDNSEPLLYQILKIAQKSKRTLEINLNVNGNHEEKSDSLQSESDSISVPENICSGSISKENIKIPLQITNGQTIEDLNKTFDVSSPIINSKSIIKPNNDNNNSQYVRTELPKTSNSRRQNDDTYDETSSLQEDTDSMHQEKVPEVQINGLEETEIKEKLTDKIKLSPPKSEKSKSKNNLSSLADLPPLNKPKVNDILPSLYNKDFKDNSNIRETDKLFDIDDEYEEDFMYSGDDLSLKSDHSNISLLKELQQTNQMSNSNEITTPLNRKETKIPQKIAGSSQKNK
ncbi:centrosomal protein 43-like [Diorhabda carinulata]|uniref:centrosomal protein 43-like n=1 Tax=Diorhabda carinulata TaxID=1163345 RepID=UPI0025A1EE3E|nr:centrosomal protein 43-like [Diorhabda carinulata]